MPVYGHTVQGEDVKIIALPPYTLKAYEAWQRFVERNEVFGLDVEATAFPVFEAQKSFGPAMALETYIVPSDLPDTVYRRGYKAGERRSIKVRTIQFGDDHEAWVLDVDHPQWHRAARVLLENQAKRFVEHNSSFDAVRVLHEFGVDLGDRSIDTLPMVNLRWPGRTSPFGSAGLKGTCAYLLKDRGLLEAEEALQARMADLYGVRNGSKLPKSFAPGVSPCRNCKEAQSWAGSKRGFCSDCYSQAIGWNKAVAEWGWTNIAIDDPVFLLYAGLDSIYVHRLLPVLAKEVSRLGMASLSRREQRTKRYFLPSGKRVDMDWTSNAKAEIQAESDAAAEEVTERTGLKVRSPFLRSDWLAKRGCKTTSLDKEHRPLLLLQFEDDEEVGPVLRAYDRFMTNANLLTNLTTILRHAEGGNGYAYPQINTLQAHTGRMSVTGPAMQTLAKSEEKGRLLRGCFIARDGHVFVGADYDNQEIRIGAYLSGDEALAHILASGLSQHVVTAERIFPDFVDKHESPVQYHKAKTLDFAQQYGAGAKKIAVSLAIPVEDAYDLWVAWRQTYAGLVRWTEEQAEKRQIVNPFGRVIPADPYRTYANGNYMIQSSGRDALGVALDNLADAGWQSTFWLPVHDEMVLEVPEDRAEAGAAALTEHMTLCLPGDPSWVLPAEGEIIGPRWRGL